MTFAIIAKNRCIEQPLRNDIIPPYIGKDFSIITITLKNESFFPPTNSILLPQPTNMREPSHGLYIRTTQNLDS